MTSLRPLLVLVCILIVLFLAWAAKAGDPRYFQGFGGATPEWITPAEAAVQLKRIASNRSIAVDGVRQVLNSAWKARQPGEERFDIRVLNQALDARWPPDGKGDDERRP
jgi:hypothetical protein